MPDLDLLAATLSATDLTAKDAAEPGRPILKWGEVAPIPDPVGLAGMYAGMSRGFLIAAGVANFPDKPPWEDGTKVWHDVIYVFDRNSGAWTQSAQKLPRPLAYGASVTHASGVIGTFASVFALVAARYVFQCNGLLYSAIGTLVCFSVGYAASLMMPDPPENIEGLSL